MQTSSAKGLQRVVFRREDPDADMVTKLAGNRHHQRALNAMAKWQTHHDQIVRVVDPTIWTGPHQRRPRQNDDQVVQRSPSVAIAEPCPAQTDEQDERDDVDRWAGAEKSDLFISAQSWAS